MLAGIQSESVKSGKRSSEKLVFLTKEELRSYHEISADN